jgi:hypothetical protein
MQNVHRIEELKVQVEQLWKRISESRAEDQERARQEYQRAYERLRRAREWSFEICAGV